MLRVKCAKSYNWRCRGHARRGSVTDRLPTCGRRRLRDRQCALARTGNRAMPEVRARGKTANQILSRLSRAAFGLLGPPPEAVVLPRRKQLEARKKRIDQIYFLDAGFASVVANGSGKRQIEIGLIGREGMSGLGVVMGREGSPHETFMQAA